MGSHPAQVYLLTGLAVDLRDVTGRLMLCQVLAFGIRRRAGAFVPPLIDNACAAGYSMALYSHRNAAEAGLSAAVFIERKSP
jgi:hypothetical protein